MSDLERVKAFFVAHRTQEYRDIIDAHLKEDAADHRKMREDQTAIEMLHIRLARAEAELARYRKLYEDYTNALYASMTAERDRLREEMDRKESERVYIWEKGELLWEKGELLCSREYLLNLQAQRDTLLAALREIADAKHDDHDLLRDREVEGEKT